MAFTRTGTVSHDSLTGISTADHHTATVGGDLNLADLNARAHADLSDSPGDAHHADLHQATHLSGGDDVIPSLARVATGLYTGDGEISQGITGIGFAPVYVSVLERRTTAGTAVGFWTSNVIVDDVSGGAAVQWGTDTVNANKIISLDADGFTVDDNGADQDPNTNAQTYNFLAIG